jgi:hypothetical protein
MGIWAGLFAAHGILLSLMAHKSSDRANSHSSHKIFYWNYLWLLLVIGDENK